MDLLDRLYFRLRQTAGEPQPAGADGNSFTIAELYQRLIPYRAVRGDLGIMELAQYEHALLRLLSGERGYVRVELPEVRDEIRRELSTPNPILGIYRDYAAVSVRLVADPAAEAERTEPLPPPPPAPPAAPAPPAEEEAVTPPPAADVSAEASPEPAACHRCQQALPDEPDLRFCPLCGADQGEAPCGECGAAMRAGWNYCIRCGTPRGGH